jgi:hypothetical protein
MPCDSWNAGDSLMVWAQPPTARLRVYHDRPANTRERQTCTHKPLGGS